MTTQRSFLQLSRLRIMRRGRAAYDQHFHEGINIVRGHNGSGKSTIADFIFFILGGEYDDWKEAARQCDEVQAEILTPRGALTLRRPIESRTSPISVYFGSFDQAAAHSLEGWETFPIRRQANKESFSQIIFRSIGVPEAQSDGAANITMHQLLRLCYSDQRTPATRLFRFESFDTQSIREAVGDLICGIGGYEIYEIGLSIRELSKDIDIIGNRLTGLLRVLPANEALQSSAQIRDAIVQIAAEKDSLLSEISRADDLVESGEVKEYLLQRRKHQERIGKSRDRMSALQTESDALEFEIREIEDFQRYLGEMSEKVSLAERAVVAIGAIEFTHCPSCGLPLKDGTEAGHCVVCKQATNPEDERSRYNRIRLDIEIQIRESKQLLLSKSAALESTKQMLRAENQSHLADFSDFQMQYAGANGPRESFLAQRTRRVGHIDAEIDFLTRSFDIAGEIDKLNDKKSALESQLDELKKKLESLHKRAVARRAKALSEISEIGSNLLKLDLRRQDEFAVAEAVEIDFVNDSIAVDGKVNFAESSNVFLKNTAILSIFLAAGIDDAFFHPRFLLLDNIEDKGMEETRSHLFQKILVEAATEIKGPWQVIFTTSMMNPKLEVEDYIIGPKYTAEMKTLNMEGLKQ